MKGPSAIWSRRLVVTAAGLAGGAALALSLIASSEHEAGDTPGLPAPSIVGFDQRNRAIDLLLWEGNPDHAVVDPREVQVLAHYDPLLRSLRFTSAQAMQFARLIVADNDRALSNGTPKSDDLSKRLRIAFGPELERAFLEYPLVEAPKAERGH